MTSLGSEGLFLLAYSGAVSEVVLGPFFFYSSFENVPLITLKETRPGTEHGGPSHPPPSYGLFNISRQIGSIVSTFISNIPFL